MPLRSNQDIFKNDKSPKHNYTKEEVEEVIKCYKDVVYFAENYCFISNFKTGKHKVRLYDYQKEILNNYQNNDLNIVQKTRQTGITTIDAIFALHYALFNEYKTIALLSTTQNIANILLHEIKDMYENLPSFLKPGVEKCNSQQIRFSNNSEILADYTSCCVLRGMTVNLLILDEFAFVKNNIATEFWNSHFPVISGTNGKIIVVSNRNSENRKTNKFWEIWCDAIDGKNSFKPFYINWNMHGERDQNWKNAYVKDLGIEKFNNEFEVSYTHPNPLEHDEYGNKRYTPKEFAKLFNVSTSTVARWRTKGKINGIQLSDRQFYYTDDDIYKIKSNKLSYRVEKSSDRNVYKIDCGNLPEDIVQKYVNELRDRIKNQPPMDDEYFTK